MFPYRSMAICTTQDRCISEVLLAAVERDLPNEVQDLAQQTDLNTSNLTGDTSLHRAADQVA